MAQTVYFGAQGAKSPLSSPSPPALQTAVAAARTAFNAVVTALGTNTFDSGNDPGTGTFNYTGGTATLTGGAVVGVLQSPPTLGRYNMTAGLPPDINTGGVDPGHWLEGTTPFTYAFSLPLTALCFFCTDFDSIPASLSIELWAGGSMFYSGAVSNPNGANGNLLFWGVTSDQAFDQVRFNISSAGNTNVLGFDTLVVGTANAPLNFWPAGCQAWPGGVGVR